MEWSEDAVEITLKDSSHTTRTFYKLNQMRKVHQLCDVEIKVHNVTFLAHTAILASNSSRVLSLLAEKRGCLVFDDPLLNAQAMDTLFEFIYTSVLRIAKSNVQPLCYAAKFLKMERVEKACCKFMSKNVSRNCFSYYRFARAHGYAALEDRCREYIATHLDVLSVVNMTAEEMAAVLGRGSLALDADGIVGVISQWVAHDYDARVRHACGLFAAVRTPWLADLCKGLSSITADIEPESFFRFLRHRGAPKYLNGGRHARLVPNAEQQVQNQQQQHRRQGSPDSRPVRTADTPAPQQAVRPFALPSPSSPVRPSAQPTPDDAAPRHPFLRGGGAAAIVQAANDCSCSDGKGVDSSETDDDCAPPPPPSSPPPVGIGTTSVDPVIIASFPEQPPPSGLKTPPEVIVKCCVDGFEGPYSTSPTFTVQRRHASPDRSRLNGLASQVLAAPNDAPQERKEEEASVKLQVECAPLCLTLASLTMPPETLTEASSGHCAPVAPTGASSGHFTPAQTMESSSHFTPAQAMESSGHFTPAQAMESSGHFTPAEPTESSKQFTLMLAMEPQGISPVQSTQLSTSVDCLSISKTGELAGEVSASTEVSSPKHITAPVLVETTVHKHKHSSTSLSTEALHTHSSTHTANSTPLGKAQSPDHLPKPPATSLGGLATKPEHVPAKCVPSPSEHAEDINGGGMVFVAGGSTAMSVTASLEKYSPTTGVWSQVPNLPRKRSHCSLAYAGKKLYVLGGMGEHQAVTAVDIYDPQVGVWQVGQGMLRAKSNFGTAVLGGATIYCIGGSDGTGDLASVEVYDTRIGKWRQGPPLPHPRSYLGAAVLEGEVYAVGGSRKNARLREVEKLGGAGMWEAVAEMNTPRSRPAVCQLGRKLYAVGGYDGTAILRSAECYVARSGKWTMIASMCSPRNSPGGAAVAGVRLLVCGGYNGKTIVSSCESYDPSEDNWVPAPSMHTARCNFGATTVFPVVTNTWL